MPAFNAEKTIFESVSSVLAQSLQDWELLIIDDGSSDETASFCRALSEKEPRIHWHMNEKNVGVAAARNIGVALAKGEYVAFLDSDDLWHSEKLNKQLEFMRETNAKISYTATAYMVACGNNNDVSSLSPSGEEGYLATSDYILRAKRELTYRDLLKRNLMSCSSVMLMREVAAKTPFPQGNHHEDYCAWMMILRKERVAYGLDEPLLIYRVSRASKSGKLSRSGVMAYRSYRHVGYSSFAALLLTLRYALHSISKRFSVRRGVL